MEIFLLGKVNLSLARGGMLIFIVCRGKRKQLTHDYYYYYFKMRSEIITLWLGSSFLKLRNIPFTLVKVVS